jgi:hypothetical protein
MKSSQTNEETFWAKVEDHLDDLAAELAGAFPLLTSNAPATQWWRRLRG